MKLFYTALFMLLSVSYSFAQLQGGKAYNWYFGFNAALNFSSGSPVPITTGKLADYEGCASISDQSGNLLFYTDGVTVWDKTNTPMPNGVGLGGNQSSTQAALIVPKPGSKTLYYIFTTGAQAGDDSDETEQVASDSGLNVSIIDMTLNGGLGNVTTKDSLLLTPTTEKLAGTMASNNSDIWVVAHQWNTANFYAYLITANGISAPVISTSGIINFDYGSGINAEAGGYLAFSPNGKKLAAAFAFYLSTVQIFDFDNTSGVVSNPITDTSYYEDNIVFPYGVCFSPDNSKLYVSAFGDLFDTNKIYQYDMSASNIIASRTTIGATDNWCYGALQLGTDGKIYVAVDSIISFLGGGNDSLGVIANPNSLGTACNFTNDGVYLGGLSNVGSLGLPNFVEQFLFPSDTDAGIEQLSTLNNQISVYPNPTANELTITSKQLPINGIQISNLLGQTIYKSTTTDLGLKQEIDLSSYANGVYFIKVTNSDGQGVVKVVKE